jgi:hypothetical protein
MLVFINNKEINLLAQEGLLASELGNSKDLIKQRRIINRKIYKKCQRQFTQLNSEFVKEAVEEQGLNFSAGKSKFNPGTDTDINVLAPKGKSVTFKDIKAIDKRYQQKVRSHFKGQNLDLPPGRFNTDTDFMPNPSHTSQEDFAKSVDYINRHGGTAYPDMESALIQERLSSGNPLNLNDSGKFIDTMKDMGAAKVRKARDLRKTARLLRNSQPKRAQMLAAQARLNEYQAAKYYDRIEDVNSQLRHQFEIDVKASTGQGLDKAVDEIRRHKRWDSTHRQAQLVDNVYASALQRATDDSIDTFAAIARKHPKQAAKIQNILAKQISSLPPGRAGQALERIDSVMADVDSGFTKRLQARSRYLQKAAAANRWRHYKQLEGMADSIGNLSKVAVVVMSAGEALLIAHQGVSTTIKNTKATDTMWDYFRNCYYHAAWEGTGIGPAFEQAQQEELIRYTQEYEQGQDPSMVKHITFTLLKTGVYMGKDAVIGVMYLPDHIWEFFTQEKAMEGYARYQNEMATVLQEMILDRKELDQALENMKAMGLHDSDAMLYLNCLCSGCGGSLGGKYDPGFEGAGRGPCKCSGPLSSWQKPLPVNDKQSQIACFNKVTNIRHNQAQALFNQWNRRARLANANSVSKELHQLQQRAQDNEKMADSQETRELAEDFADIKELLLPEDANNIRGLVNPLLEDHAFDNFVAGNLQQGLKNIDAILGYMGTVNLAEEQRLEQLREQYAQWQQPWKQAKERHLPAIAKLLEQDRLQAAQQQLQAILRRMQNPPGELPPAQKDKDLMKLKQAVGQALAAQQPVSSRASDPESVSSRMPQWSKRPGDMSDWQVSKAKFQVSAKKISSAPGGDGATSYYEAPKRLLGDWTRAKHILLEKKSSGGRYYSGNHGDIGDVVLDGPGGRATFHLAEDHSGAWKKFRLPLEEGKWTLSKGADSLTQVVQHVGRFRIRAEYGYGKDTSALRGVSVVGEQKPIKAALKWRPEGKPVIKELHSIAAVENGPRNVSAFRVEGYMRLEWIRTYHWNHGKGASLGTIALRDDQNRLYGPWPAHGTEGQGGVVNAYWNAWPGVILLPGRYTIVDSDPDTWATNAQVKYRGIYKLKLQKMVNVSKSGE